jgi:hypothetical protein
MLRGVYPSMTFRLRWGKVLRVIGVVILVLVATLATYIHIQQRILRTRVERLLEDIRELQSHQGTWTDAQRFMERWGPSKSTEPCTKDSCSYSIEAEIEYPTVIHICGRLPSSCRLLFASLNLLGGHTGFADASFEVKDGIITQARFEVIVEVPPGASKLDMEGYGLVGIATQGVPTQTSGRFGPYDFRAQRLLHPEYWIGSPGGCEGCIKLMTGYTPLVSREKMLELTGFNFSCFTQWLPCTTEEDLLPSAWKQHQEESPGNQARDEAFEKCRVPLDFLAQEYAGIAIADVLPPIAEEVFPGKSWSGAVHDGRAASSAEDPQEHWAAVRMSVVRSLKGPMPWPLNKAVVASVFGRGEAPEGWNSTNLVAGHRYILFAAFETRTPEGNVMAIDDCGVVPYSEQNLLAIQRGIDASLAGSNPQK